MADEVHPQNKDPFLASFEPLYREGRLIDVPITATQNGADREAKRAALVAGRVAPERPRAEVLAGLQAERDRAAEFLAQADRVLKPSRAAASQSAMVDAILAEEGVTEDSWAEREARMAADAEEVD